MTPQTPLRIPFEKRHSLATSMHGRAGPDGPAPRSPNLGFWALLHVRGGAGFLKPRDRLLGVGLADVLQHRLRRRINEVLGLLQTELGQLADGLDHVDLAVPDRAQGDS